MSEASEWVSEAAGQPAADSEAIRRRLGGGRKYRYLQQTLPYRIHVAGPAREVRGQSQTVNF
jgi:hypothetical protein